MKKLIGKYPNCEQQKKDHKIVIKEKKNKSQLIIDNPNEFIVLIIEVDGCVIKQETACDYLILPHGKEYQEEIYVELKGQDIRHGVQQIETTIKRLSNNIQTQKKICFIVPTRVNPQFKNDIQKYKKIFKQEYNATLIVKNTPCIHEIL